MCDHAPSQVQTLAHACALRRTLGPIHCQGYRPGAEAIAAATLSATAGESAAASASDAVASATRAAGWLPTHPGLMRLRELLGEASKVRDECVHTHIVNDKCCIGSASALVAARDVRAAGA